MTVDLDALRAELEGRGWRLVVWLEGAAPDGAEQHASARFHVDGMQTEADIQMATNIMRKHGVKVDTVGALGEA